MNTRELLIHLVKEYQLSVGQAALLEKRLKLLVRFERLTLLKDVLVWLETLSLPVVLKEIQHKIKITTEIINLDLIKLSEMETPCESKTPNSC